MKKNKMMRLASAMMVLTLMSTSVISGTFAKYVTSDSATDTARVAKWGVTVTQTGDKEVFSTVYDDNSNPTVASTVDKLVAPGTKNDTGLTFTINGTPEVKCRIEVELAGVGDDNKFDATKEPVDVKLPQGDTSVYTDDPTTGVENDAFTVDEDYYPVLYKLTGNGLKNAENVTVTEITGNLEDIETALEKLTQDVAPNTDLSTTFGTYTLTWEWPYEANSTDEAVIAERDRKDTMLGKIAKDIAEGTATVTGASTDIKFGVKISVTQID